MGPILSIGNPSVANIRENPTIYSVVLRLALASAGAGCGAFFLSSKLFKNAHARTVVIIFSLVFSIYLLLNGAGALAEPRYGLALDTLTWLTQAIPTGYVIIVAWKGAFFTK